MVSVRLYEEYNQKLDKISEIENKSKSEIIKIALYQYFKNYENDKSPYELGKDLFGKRGSEKGNLSKDYKKILKEKINEKYSH